MESQIRTIGLLITFVAIIYALHRGRDMPALVFLALSPLSYFAQNVYVVVSPAKLMGLVFLGVVAFKPSYLSLFRSKYLGAFLPYFFYVFGLTIFMPVFWPEYTVSEQSFFYGNTMRGFVQIFQMTMGLAIIAVIVGSLTSANALFRAQVVLLVTMTLICIYGIYVWFAQRLGLPFNPINRQGQGGALGHKITSVVDGVYRMRAYSVTGEPKTLAANACVGFMLMSFTPVRHVGFLKGFMAEMALVFLFLSTLLLTLSTAGYMILPMMMIVGFAIQVRIGQLRSKAFVHFIAIAIILSLLTYLMGIDVAGILGPLFESRLTERLNDDGFFTYAETAILKFWADKPYLAITGVGLGGSTFYIREYDTLSYAGYTAAPRGVIGFISDRGIIGLLLFLMPLVKASRSLIAGAVSNSPNRRVYMGILIICAITTVMLFTTGQWHDEWLVVGLICAGAVVANRERHAIRTARVSVQSSSSARHSVRL